MKHFWPALTRYGLCAFVFLLPWQTRWIVKTGYLNGGIWEYGTYSLYAVDILLIALTILTLTHRRANSRVQGAISGLDLAIWCLVGAGALSFFWAVNRSLALFALWKLAEGGLLVWLIGVSTSRLSNIVRWFVGGAVVQSLLGLTQFFTQRTWANKWLGLTIHDPSQLGTIVVQTADSRILRAYAGLPHPNIFGGLMAVSVICIFGLYFDLYSRILAWFDHHPSKLSRRVLWRNHTNVMRNFAIEIVCYLIAFIICTAGLLVSFSRGAWLGAVVGLFVFVGFGLLQQRAVTIIATGKLITVMFLIAAIFIVIAPQLWLTRVTADGSLEQQSLTSRETYQGQAITLMQKYWLIGTGLGNYTAGLHEQFSNLQPWAYQPVHNLILLITVELGFPGIIVFGFLLFEIFRRVYRTIANRSIINVWVMAFSASFICLFVVSMFDHYLWSLSFGIFLWWLVVSLLRKSTL